MFRSIGTNFISVLFLLACSKLNGQTAVASFSSVDTACVNSPVSIVNNSTGASSYYWNFCVGSTSNVPTGTLLGNVGNAMAVPVFVDYAQDNGNYYAFVVNNSPGGLVRLSFGSSLLNTPVVTDFGNIGGAIPNSAQGIQVVQNNGRWYAIVVGGDPSIGIGSRVIKVDFGINLSNTPVATNWGNIGAMNYPVDIFMFQQGAVWYGLTVNYRDNSITQLRFGTDFNTPPTGTNYGNQGGMNLPSGICPVNDNGVWRVFVANFGNSTLSRIDFGNSLSNPPSSAVNLGNPGGQLNTPRDLYIFKNCGATVGFLVNDNTGDIVRMGFSSLSATPTLTSLGKIGGADNPHSISKIFRINSDLYAFLPNSYNNSLSRIMFSGCTTASAANSSVANPPPVTYHSPGIYNINLTVDEGTVNEASFCKQVTVLAPQNLNIPASYQFCEGKSVQLNVQNAQIFQWTPTTGLSAANIANPIASPSVNTVYSLTVTDNSKCVQTVSVPVNKRAPPLITAIKSADLGCSGDTVQLIASGGSTYTWQPSTGLSNLNIANPFVTGIATNITYSVTGTDTSGCSSSASVTVAVPNTPPVISVVKSADLQCASDTIQLSASGGIKYFWSPATGLSDPSIANPLVTGINTNTTYTVQVLVTKNCKALDSVTVGFSNIGLSTSTYQVPNAFTPNNDGLNDCFGIPQVWGKFKRSELTIYNRFGQMIYYSTDQNKCWDGKLNSVLQPSGNYIYIIKASSSCQAVERHGSFVLIR